MTRRFRLDPSVQRHGAVLVGGSPLRLFRLTSGGRVAVERIAAGEPVPDSRLVTSLLDAGAIHPIVDRSRRFGSTDVTIVVPTLGEPAAVPDGALVVDDGSEPPVDGATVRLECNRGPAAARNVGLGLVTTPLVAVVDADVVLPDGWLDGLLGHFDDERVVAVAPRIRSAEGDSSIAAHERGHSPLDLGDVPARVRAGTRVSYVPAAVLVMRTELVRASGGFDEALRFGEDVDLVWRFDDAGWWVRYEPSVTVEHAPRATLRSWFRQRIDYGSSAAPLARRHPGRLAPARMSGWSLATWASAVVLHPMVGAMGGAASAAALPRRLPDLPWTTSFGLAVRGHLHAGRQLARAVRRVWWPFLVATTPWSRRARRALAVSVLAAGRPAVVVDDVAYSIGVWRGMWRERSLAAAMPDVTTWPQRRAADAR